MRLPARAWLSVFPEAVGEELGSGPLAVGVPGAEVPAFPEAAGGGAGQGHGDDRPLPSGRPQVTAGQLLDGQHLWAAHIKNPPRRLAQHQGDEPLCHLVHLDRLELETARQQQDGRVGKQMQCLEDQIVELGRPRQP